MTKKVKAPTFIKLGKDSKIVSSNFLRPSKDLISLKSLETLSTLITFANCGP